MGADPEAVKAVGGMASNVRKIVKALGKGQEQTGDQEPPEPQPRSLGEGVDAMHAQVSAARA